MKTGTDAVKQVADLSETKGLVKQLLPEIPPETNIQLEAYTKGVHETITPDVDIPKEARARLKELLETKYTSTKPIVSATKVQGICGPRDQAVRRGRG